MPDAHDPHGPASAANGSDIATLLRAFDNYNATPQGREVHIPAGATQSGRAVPALAIWMDDNTLCVEVIADDGARSEAPEEERAWVLDRIRATDPEMADLIEAAATAAVGDEDTSAMGGVAGIDDLADGLPTLEEARSLLDGISREQSDAEGEVVELQGALRRMYFTAEPISAAEAYRLGLVDVLVAPEALEETVQAMAAKIATKSPIGLRIGKKSMNEAEEMAIDVGYAREQSYSTMLMRTEDAREATLSLVEKRPPVFVGR